MDPASLSSYLAYCLTGLAAALMLIVAVKGNREKKKSLCILATVLTVLVVLGNHWKRQPRIDIDGFKRSTANLEIEKIGLITKTKKIETAMESLDHQLHEKNVSEILCRSDLSRAQKEIATLVETVSSLHSTIDNTTRQLAKTSSRVQNLDSRIDLALIRADVSLQRMNKLGRDSEISKHKYDRRLPGSADPIAFVAVLAAGHNNLTVSQGEMQFITTVLRTGEAPKSEDHQ